MANSLKEISEGQGDLNTSLDISSNDEIGVLANSFNSFVAKLKEIISEVIVSSNSLFDASQKAADTARSSLSDVQDQLHQVTLVATAVEEMTMTTKEISTNAEEAARSANETADYSKTGQKTVVSAKESIDVLADDISGAAQVINRLNENAQQINSILITIKSIAEQTNLLALNAAIESARAGEHGRGFAVVAEEVRNLSQKTSTSTEEIQKMITSLQTISEEAVDLMKGSLIKADHSVDAVNLAHQQLGQITESVEQINHMVGQIAMSTEQQMLATNEIAQNAFQIKDIANQMSNNADKNLDRSRVLHSLSENINAQVGQFEV